MCFILQMILNLGDEERSAVCGLSVDFPAHIAGKPKTKGTRKKKKEAMRKEKNVQ